MKNFKKIQRFAFFVVGFVVGFGVVLVVDPTFLTVFLRVVAGPLTVVAGPLTVVFAVVPVPLTVVGVTELFDPAGFGVVTVVFPGLAVVLVTLDPAGLVVIACVVADFVVLITPTVVVTFTVVDFEESPSSDSVEFEASPSSAPSVVESSDPVFFVVEVTKTLGFVVVVTTPAGLIAVVVFTAPFKAVEVAGAAVKTAGFTVVDVAVGEVEELEFMDPGLTVDGVVYQVVELKLPEFEVTLPFCDMKSFGETIGVLLTID